MCFVNRRGLGKAKHVDMQNLWIQESSKSGRLVTKMVGTSVNPADLVTKPLPKPQLAQLMNITSYEIHDNVEGRVEVSIGERSRSLCLLSGHVQ